MLTILAIAGLLLLLALAGADLLVSGISSDELTRMGLQH
jgi:hypothetical protein